MIKRRATKLVAVLIIVVGLALPPPLDDDNSTQTTSSAARPVVSPQFQISWRRGVLTLTGHTVSADHEQDLLQVSAASYLASAVITDFQPLGIVPPHWADTTVQVVYLLAETTSANATLFENELTIQGVTTEPLGWQNRLNALKQALPRAVTVMADALVVDAGVSVDALCDQATAGFDAGPIGFEESSAEFRSSAYPRLDRLIALADACPGSVITITGHTDASGSEAWNQSLSLKRADAVGDYVVNGGIERSRLVVAGAGSSSAIADNATRYGRSLNRRIEIHVSRDTR